jgi:hypothetical protein
MIEVTGQTVTVFVGQEIHLRPGINQNWGVLIGGKTKWTLPSDARIVRNYHNDNSHAEVTELAESDKQNDEIIFYFVDGSLSGKSREVKADCVFKDSRGEEIPKTVNVTLTVKAPELVNKSSKTDQVALYPIGAPKAEHLRFGNITKVKGARHSKKRIPGIKWDWSIKVPEGVDAEVKDIQVKKAGCISRRVDRTTGVTEWHCIPGEHGPTSHDQLDNTNPYCQPGDFADDRGRGGAKGFPRTVAGGDTCSENESEDSPQEPLKHHGEVECHDKFEYFVMYKPDSKKLDCPTIWVPVARAKWFWKGHAQVIDKKWTMVSSDHSHDPQLEPTTDFPLYQSNWARNRKE